VTWFNVREIRVREHTAKRPGSKPCLMVVYSLDEHEDVFDWLAFESDKPFAIERAGDRWLALKGESPIPETTAEAMEREGELCTPKCVMITKDGDWERVNKVRFDEDLKAEAVAAALEAKSLIDARAYLDETTTPEPLGFDFSKFKGST
jgi:hypothetical protein